MATPIQGFSSVSNLSNVTNLTSAAANTPGDAGDGQSFKDFLVQSIQEVNTMQADADKAVEKLSTGGDVSPAEVLTAVQKADVAFQMMIQVRNQLVNAYTEIKNLQI